MLTEKQVLKNIAEAVSVFLKEENMTQTDLGAISGISQPVISNILKMKVKLNVYTIYKLSDVIGVTADEMLRGK